MSQKHWILVSYATGREFFHKRASLLEKACKRFDIPYDIQIIEDKGSHRLNTRYKPAFVLEMLEKHKRAVFWSDVDNTIHQPFDFEEYESLAATPKKGHELQFLASCLYFPYNEETLELVRQWKQLTMGSSDSKKNIGDHKAICKLTNNQFHSLGWDFHSLQGGTGKIISTGISRNFK